MPEVKRVSHRVQAHVDALRAAGLNTQAFFDALVGIRDDRALTEPQRDALYRLVAMECFIWYMEAIRGGPVDRIKLAEEAAKIAMENEAAIKQRTPGGAAAELATKDIGGGAPPPNAPPPGEPRKLRVPTAATSAERPSSKAGTHPKKK